MTKCNALPRASTADLEHLVSYREAQGIADPRKLAMVRDLAAACAV